jgi:deoxyribodipyrimidine photolyase
LDLPAAPGIALFRRDLRLDDNQGLAGAASGGRSILPVFDLPELARLPTA